MATVIGKTKKEHDEKFMQKQSGKSQDKKPHEMPHEIIHKETGETHGPYESLEHAYNEYQNFHPQTDYAIGRVMPSAKERVKKMDDELHEKAKSHPKYEKLKSALGKQGAMDAILKEMNEKQ
jgi:hypothetical protein